MIPIVGARKVAQVEDNLHSIDIRFSDEHTRRLNEASRIELGFPHDFYAMEIVRGFTYADTYDLIDKPTVRN